MHGIGDMSFGRAEKANEDQNESEMSNYRKNSSSPRPRDLRGGGGVASAQELEERLWGLRGAGCTGRGERSPWTVLPRDISVGKGYLQSPEFCF